MGKFLTGYDVYNVSDIHFWGIAQKGKEGDWHNICVL